MVIASGDDQTAIGPRGYLAAYAIADDNLRLGLTVVADSVNSLSPTRKVWRDVACRAGVRIFEIELICSDTTVHRLRVEGRQADIPGHKLPTWKNIQERQYDAWKSEHFVVDTANLSVEEALEKISLCLPMSRIAAYDTETPSLSMQTTLSCSWPRRNTRPQQLDR